MAELRRFIRLPAVCDAVGYRKSTIWNLVAANRFPQPVKLGEGKRPSIAWDAAEVAEWQEARIRARDAAVGKAA